MFYCSYWVMKMKKKSKLKNFTVSWTEYHSITVKAKSEAQAHVLAEWSDPTESYISIDNLIAVEEVGIK